MKQMTKSECRMTKQAPSPNDEEATPEFFVI